MTTGVIDYITASAYCIIFIAPIGHIMYKHMLWVKDRQNKN